MKCPKCGYDSLNEISCSHCGIIFQKYATQEFRKRQLEDERLDRRDRLKRQWITIGVVTSIVLLLTGFFLLPDDTPDDSLSADQTSQDRKQPRFMVPGIGPGYWTQDGTQLKWVSTPGETRLNNVRDSTFNFGLGIDKGFIITNECHAIINSDLSKRKASKGTGPLKQDKVYLDILLDSRDEAKAIYEEHRKKFISNCKDCSKKAFDNSMYQYASKLKEIERKISQAQAKLDQSKEYQEHNDVVWAHTHYGRLKVRQVEHSVKLGLSLVMLDREYCENIPRGDPASLTPGEPVFTLQGHKAVDLLGGEYLGISKTGKSSNYIKHNIKVRKADQGFPLLDRDGNVIGITIESNSGKSVAIPIDMALRELKLLI
ncbi:MAG: serine protease [Candidatus Thiodiazotropha sp. (ex Monitilora ramsayi)]|nr:serine protease [Candidatus Thiodiazotropha sp. (ex Monitilora ramsayi)]